MSKHEYIGEWSEKDEQFLRDNHDTLTNQQLADALGRSVTSVAARKSMLMLSTRSRKGKVLEGHVEEIQRLVNKETSHADIAKHFGVTTSVMGYFIRKNHIVKQYPKYDGNCPRCSHANTYLTYCNAYRMVINSEMLTYDKCQRFRPLKKGD